VEDYSNGQAELKNRWVVKVLRHLKREKDV
jgi:hypothetical protein